MAWTYTNDMTDELNQVRFLIQDTNSTRQLYQDEEIVWVLGTEANVYTAAAMLCDTLVTKGGGGGLGVKSKKIGEFAVTYDVALYRQLSMTLRARGAGHQVPYAAGISVADKLTQQLDTDAVQPKVYRGLDENPAAPQPDIPSNNPLTTI